MKVALMGIGRWGKVLLAELSKLAEVKYRCDSKTDLAPVFADTEVEAVFIATPTATHFEIAQKALEADKHVFLEKPGTDSSEKLGKLVKLAEAKSLRFAVGYEFPHHPAAQKLKELIKGRAIKKLYFDWQKWGTFKDNAVKHLLCHEVSIAKSLGINIKPLSSRKTGVISDSDLVEAEFDKMSARINRVSPVKQKTITVILEDTIYIWSNNDLFEVDKEKQKLKKIELPAQTAVAAEIDDFLKAIRKNREAQSSGQFALAVYKIIEQV